MTTSEEPKGLVKEYPESISDEDIDLIVKEWRLSGCVTLREGNTVAILDPTVDDVHSNYGGGVTTYHRVGGSWHLVDSAEIATVRESIVKEHYWSTAYGGTGPAGPTGGTWI